HETPDAFHDLVAERLHSSQSIGARKLEQIALSLEPAGKWDRCADRDGGAAIAFPSTRDQSRRIPPEIMNDFPKLLRLGRPRAAVGGGALPQQRAILEHTVVIDRDRNHVQPRAIRGIAGDAEHVVEETDLRRAQLAVSR